MHHCLRDEDELLELQKYAQNFEEKICAGVTSEISRFVIYLQLRLHPLSLLSNLYDSLPQQPKSDQLEKIKIFKRMCQHVIAFLQVSKSNILPNFKKKLGSYKKQIINFINANRPSKAMSSMQTGQFPPVPMNSVPQPQSQLTQVQSHENQINSVAANKYTRFCSN